MNRRGDVEALILAGGTGNRLGRGPKAYLELAGDTLLTRAIRACGAVTDRVVAAIPGHGPRATARTIAATPQVRTIPAGATRFETFRALVDAARADLLVLHDVVHPLASEDLFHRVIDAAERSGAAAAAIPADDFVYAGDGRVVAAPGELWVAQKPIVFRRETMERALARRADSPPGSARPEPGSLDLLASVGQEVTLVRGERWNVKLTDEHDWAVIRALVKAAPGTLSEPASGSGAA